MPRIAIPRNAEEMREQLTDRKVLRELLQDPEGFADHIENSVNERFKSDPSILAQVNEQVENVKIEWLKNQANVSDNSELKRKLNLADPRSNGIANKRLYNKSAIGAKHDSMFADASEFFFNISEHSTRDVEMQRKLNTLKNDLSSVKPSDGGFLIPEVLRAELLRVALEKAIVRSRARVIPMDSLTVPFPAVDATSNVSSVYGGVVGYWTEEGATLTESQPRFSRVELKANKLTLYTEVPNELIRDARPSLEAFINDIFPEALAWFEDIAFFVGGGVGEPLGFMNAPARIQVTRQASGNSVDWLDLATMYTRMLPQSLDSAVWIVSPDTMVDLLTMPFIQGGASPILLGGGGGFASGSGSPVMTILGRPVIVSEKARAKGTAGDINFVDFNYYLVGDRQAMSARQSEEYRFQNDITAFRVIERVDGRPWLQSAITPYNGAASTLSPFVQLA
jgi:HK97 family phage major capsid protein